MSAQGNDDGLVDAFVKGAVFTVGAAVAGLVLRRVFRQEPEVVVVAVSADELSGGRGGADKRGGADGRGAGGRGRELGGPELAESQYDDRDDRGGDDELDLDLDDLADEEDGA